jgi:hypothetical protein
MTKEFISIAGANIDIELFAAYKKKAFEELQAESDAKDTAKDSAKDFKETVESCHLTTKLPKKDISAYFKALFEESRPKEDDGTKDVGTKVIINRGILYDVLNSALDR